MGGPQKSHLDAVGSLLLWVCYALGGLASRALILILTPHRWLAWACDAIDFFSVSLNIVNLEAQFNRSTHDLVSYAFQGLLLHLTEPASPARRRLSLSHCCSVQSAL